MMGATFLVALVINVLTYHSPCFGYALEGTGGIDLFDRAIISQSLNRRANITREKALDRSDDFYLGISADADQSIRTVSSATYPNHDRDSFYEAVDYESASATYLVPQSNNVTSRRLQSGSTSMRTANQSKSSSFKIFKVFAWKGFGLSFEKSVIQWNAFGAGVRVPVSSNFPEWDRNAAIPKISTTFGLNYPYGCKISVSASIPLGTAVYGKIIGLVDFISGHFKSYVSQLKLILHLNLSTGLMLLGKTVGGFKSSVAYTSYLERLKKPKAVDSIKRVGVTATIRYSEAKGFHCQIGPQWFYYPGQVVMRHLLPMIFSLPALFVTLLGLFLQLDGSLDKADVISASSKHADTLSAVTATATATATGTGNPSPGFPYQSTLQNRTKSTIRNQKRKSSAMSSAATSSKNSSAVSHNITDTAVDSVGRRRRKWTYPRGVRFWHNKILEWAGTKSTGLGYNMGWRYQGLHDASLGSRIVFEIQSFYPFPKTLKRLSGMNFTSFFAPYFGGSNVALLSPTAEPILPFQQTPVHKPEPEYLNKKTPLDMLVDLMK